LVTTPAPTYCSRQRSSSVSMVAQHGSPTSARTPYSGYM
jgi:hypothetical protein